MIGYNGADSFPPEFDALLDPFTVMAVAASATVRVSIGSSILGRYWSLPATRAELKPVQRPRPPIFLAGFAPAAMRRVAGRADGWMPGIAPGLWPVDPAVAIAGPMAQIRALAEEQGRDPGELGMILRVYPAAAASLEEIVSAIVRAREEAGVDHAFVDLMYQATSVDHALELTGRILDLVRPA